MPLSKKILAATAVSALLVNGAAFAQQGNQGQQPSGQSQPQQNTQQQAQGQNQQQVQSRQQQQAQARNQQRQQARQGQRQVQIQGEIVDLRRATLRDSNRQNVLALVENQQGRRAVVDLGTGIRGERLQPGQRIAVRGEPVRMGQNRTIVMASAVRLNGQTYPVSRQAREQRQAQRAAPMQYRQVRGEVVDLRRVNVRGTDRQNVLALLETPAGQRVTVDLGTGVQGQRLQQGQRIAVRGEPVRLGQDRTVLMASAVRMGGRTYDVNRPGERGYTQVRGTVSDVRQAQLATGNQRNVLVLIETPAGQRGVVDIGQGIRGVPMRPGQQFAARGTPVLVGPDRAVLMAHAARLDDRTYDINRVLLIPEGNLATAD